ncbi:MAG: methionine ABC transporter ATP-binding protein [Enterococcus sp.]
MTKIAIHNLSVVFKQKKQTITAVENINLQVNSGEIYGIVGLSGAGKSTLIRTINLLQVPTTGSIKIDDQEITQLRGDKLRQTRKKIGMIFQHFNLITNRTIGENIEFALNAGNYPVEKRSQRIQALLKLVDLEDKRDSYPNNLSGGQKQRIGIARALANEPEILLCDEATSALDVETTEEILRILERINRELGITIVFITHELEVAKRLFHRMAVMENGQIVEEGTTYQIFSEPKQAVTQKLVGRYLNLTVPTEVMSQLSQGELLELRYQGENTLEPLISNVSKEFNVSISIVHGKIEYIRHDVIGILYVYITGKFTEIEKTIAKLKANVHFVRQVTEE